MEMNKGWVAPVAIAAAAAVLTAAVGATITDLGPWYQSLVKPDWTPPDPAFGAIWTLIFTLAAISAVYAWRAAPNPRAGGWIAGLFALNGFLNILWSLLFFRMQRPDWAFVEVAVLFASIVLLIGYTGRFSRMAALLLLPYLAWVGAAAALNYQVIALNPAFG